MEITWKLWVFKFFGAHRWVDFQTFRCPNHPYCQVIPMSAPPLPSGWRPCGIWMVSEVGKKGMLTGKMKVNEICMNKGVQCAVSISSQWSSAYGPVAPRMPLFSSLSCWQTALPSVCFLATTFATWTWFSYIFFLLQSTSMQFTSEGTTIKTWNNDQYIWLHTYTCTV